MTPTAARSPTRLSHREIMVVLGGLMTGMLLAALDQTIVATALPTIVGDLGGLEHLSWVVTAYLLTSTAAIPLYGKVSDLYGRRVVFQVAIVVFLSGSALAGLAQSMLQLIVARGVQGVGAGGLIAMTMTIIGDIISPRDRGRYQGYVGAVFALSSVLGPLAGGFFTDHLSWRWVFYVNLPIGVVALLVTSSVLRLPFVRHRHRIDVEGAALLVAGVTCLLLVAVWGGNTYPWGSPLILGLAAAAIVLIGAFVWWEGRTAEPILPLELFRQRVFSIATPASFVVGAAMFGGIVFLPLFLQTAQGQTATNSGLLLLPLVVGIVTTSILSGRLIARTGRYRVFPIAGMAVATVGMYLLSRLGIDSSRAVSSIAMLVLGVGIGMVMQVLVLAVQNAVEHRNLGTATSAVNFFRSMGGALGVALYGAVFTMRFRPALASLLPPGAGGGLRPSRLAESPAAIRALPDPIRDAVTAAIADSVHTVFLAAIPLVVIGLLLVLMLPEVPLRETAHVGAEALVEGFEEPAAARRGLGRIGTSSRPPEPDGAGNVGERGSWSPWRSRPAR